MSKAPTEIRSLARSHTEAAINCLVGVMNRPDANDAARVSAANSLLDRGWGKPTQPLSGDEENPLTLIHKIERVIVRPSDTNG